MKKTKRITFCAMMAALSAAFMLVSYFPYLTYAIPALSGLFIMVAVIEYGAKWGIFSYLASAFPVFLLAELESKLLYLCFFGFYPIIKAITEKIKKFYLEWLIKFLFFNISVVSVYFLFSGVLGVSLEDFGIFGKYGAFIFLGMGNGVFVLYDIAVSRMSMFYFCVIKPRIKFKM